MNGPGFCSPIRISRIVGVSLERVQMDRVPKPLVIGELSGWTKENAPFALQNGFNREPSAMTNSSGGQMLKTAANDGLAID